MLPFYGSTRKLSQLAGRTGWYIYIHISVINHQNIEQISEVQLCLRKFITEDGTTPRNNFKKKIHYSMCLRSKNTENREVPLYEKSIKTRIGNRSTTHYELQIPIF